MKIFFIMFMLQLVIAIRQGISNYSDTIEKYDPCLTFGIFGFLGNIGSGLWNAAKGAIGGFFGKGGAVTVAGPPAPAFTATAPLPLPSTVKKDNTFLYVGIAAGVVIFVVLIIMLTKK